MPKATPKKTPATLHPNKAYVFGSNRFGDSDREQVRRLAGVLNKEHIARLIRHPKTGAPISARSLQTMFAQELKDGRIEADAAVGLSLLDMALGRPAEYDRKGNCVRAELPPNVTAAIFMAKTRLRWTEKERPPATVVIPSAATPQDVVNNIDARTVNFNGYTPADLAAAHSRLLAGEDPGFDIAANAPASAGERRPKGAGADKGAQRK